MNFFDISPCNFLERLKERAKLHFIMRLEMKVAVEVYQEKGCTDGFLRMELISIMKIMYVKKA